MTATVPVPVPVPSTVSERPSLDGRRLLPVGAGLSLEWLRAQAVEEPGDGHWTSMAKASLSDDLLVQQRRLAVAAAQFADAAGDARTTVSRWLGANREHARGHVVLLDELRAAAGVDVAMLTIAVQQLRELAPQPPVSGISDRWHSAALSARSAT